ncbi:MAG: (Fe-S)-binding protein [Thermoleophilia bacterium]|nr:(Fe-S)-binding protein [Thermoleophilia bacterium]
MKASLMITCLGDALYPRVGVSAVKVLEALGVEVDFPPGQVCCGQPAFNSGYRDEARTAARAYLKAFAASAHVVSISGSCAAMVRRHYPVLFEGRPEEAEARALAARTYEFSQFLTDVLGVTELPVRHKARVTFHHSCHTRRHLGVVEQPERLLAMVEGLDYVPLPRAEECCGFGGTFAVKMPEISSSLVDDKVEHVLETGADELIGLDMSCLMNIGGRLSRRGSGVRVRHLAEVLAEGWGR